LLVLDDFGLHPLDPITRLALLQILEDRNDKKSVIITSQLPCKRQITMYVFSQIRMYYN